MPDLPSTLTRFISTRFAPRTLACAMLLGAASCSKGPAERLSGKWVGDRIDNVSADDVARATGWVKGTTFEFAGDKLKVTIPAETPRTGTYKVAKVEGDRMVLSVTRPDAAQPDEAKLTMLDERTLRWDIGQTREVVLVRLQ